MNVSARNQVPGKVVCIKKDKVMSVVTYELECGLRMSAVITTAALEDMGVEEGMKVTGLIKATQVMLAVE
ncbi:MAG: TOBE domain-containing protein [Bacillota bacterium]|jgi:molybdopterin-binding protein